VEHISEGVLEFDEREGSRVREILSINKQQQQGKKPKERPGINRVWGAMKTVYEVDQASGDTHREVASCTKLFLEKVEVEGCRSSGKE